MAQATAPFLRGNMILVNGCSHTSGSEIEFYMQHECKDKAWPAHLGQLMNQDVINIALAGSGNERISRTTIEWLIKNVQLQQNYKPADLTVIIMWSGFDRFEEWNSRLKQFVSSQSDAFYDDKLPEFSEYAKYKKIINTWASNEYKNLIYILHTAVFLESLGIKYYFINGVQSFSTRDKFLKTGMASEFDTMYRGYGDNRIQKHLAFINENELPKHQLRDIPYAPHARWPHWDERGHKAWATIVYNWINSTD